MAKRKRAKKLISPGDVTLWCKGFSVTRESPEFQLVVPNNVDDLSRLERSVNASTDWATSLESLYTLSERELTTQRCLLFRQDEALVLSLGGMLDRMSRRAVLVVGVAVEVDWEDPAFPSLVAKASGLGARLVAQYSKAFREPAVGGIERQLRSGAFLDDRTFELVEEHSVGEDTWTEILSAVRKMKGITGVASPALAFFPANVILGTKHEAEIARAQGGAVDGYFDVRAGAIVPLTATLEPWVAPTEVGNIAPPQEGPASSEPQQIEQSPHPTVHLEDEFEIPVREIESAAYGMLRASFNLLRIVLRKVMR